MMLYYNDGEKAAERAETKPLTLNEQLEVVHILNMQYLTIKEKQLVQRFLNHYQNMEHYVSYTSGDNSFEKITKEVNNAK